MINLISRGDLITNARPDDKNVVIQNFNSQCFINRPMLAVRIYRISSKFSSFLEGCSLEGGAH